MVSIQIFFVFCFVFDFLFFFVFLFFLFFLGGRRQVKMLVVP